MENFGHSLRYEGLKTAKVSATYTARLRIKKASSLDKIEARLSSQSYTVEASPPTIDKT
jgi:hypothetical protein